MRIRIRRPVGLGLVASLAIGVAAITPAAAANPWTTRVGVNQQCMAVDGPSGATGVVRQLTSGGEIMGERPVSIGGGGQDEVCFYDPFLPGMKIQGEIGGVVRTSTVPTLSLRINRATDVVRGSAPAGKSVHVNVIHWSSFTSSVQKGTNVTASSTGSYSRDLTTLVNIAGGDSLDVSYTSSAGDFWGINEVAPRLGVWINRAQMGAELLSGSGGSVSLRTSGGTLRATGYVSWLNGEDLLWDFGIFAKNGTPVTARIGDKVSSSIQSNMSLTIPRLTVVVAASTDVVSGSCPAGKSLRWTLSNGSSLVYVGAGSCSAGGTYSVDLTAHADVVAGQRIEVVVRLSTGDYVYRRAIVQ
jgi:hypothetical protein